MRAPGAIVTLTTDFGVSDTFVGEMKGVVLGIAPHATVVDLTHAVPAHDVAAGAFLLAAGCRAFPPGTVHVAVVDPGVGTARRAVAVEADDHVFVGPDNGVLARALRGRRTIRAHALEDPAFVRPARARTFEGRDRFAPAAGWIAAGTPLSRLGPAVTDLAIDAPGAVPAPGGGPVEVRVAHVDRFGNVFLDLDRGAIEDALAAGAVLRVTLANGARFDRRVATYADIEPGRTALLFNSADVVELAEREGSAAERWGVRRGDRVQVAIDRSGADGSR